MDFLEFHNTRRGEGYYPWTDKNTVHSYITDYYNGLFTPLKEEEIKILEIGVFRQDALRLFRDWFTKAEIHGLDDNSGCAFTTEQLKEFNENKLSTTIVPGTQIYLKDAYTQEVLDSYPNEHFDIIIDDGSHHPDHQMYALMNWIHKVKRGGQLIIEDIPDMETCKKLLDASNAFGQPRINHVLDLRYSGRFDNMLFIVKKL